MLKGTKYTIQKMTRRFWRKNRSVCCNLVFNCVLVRCSLRQPSRFASYQCTRRSSFHDCSRQCCRSSGAWIPGAWIRISGWSIRSRIAKTVRQLYASSIWNIPHRCTWTKHGISWCLWRRLCRTCWLSHWLVQCQMLGSRWTCFLRCARGSKHSR